MKNILVVMMMFLSISASAAVKSLQCLNDQARWTSFGINIDSPKQVSLKILDAVSKDEIGLVAHLSFVDAVSPNGRIFLHYKGTFINPGNFQKTVAIYLSQDLKTLTRMIKGDAYNYSCRDVTGM